jgi:hypothetical protein
MSDPHNRDAWEWTGHRVDARPPISGVVLNSENDQRHLDVRGRRVPPRPPRVDPFALLGDGRPADVPATPVDLIEILIDRELLEADLFAGGAVQVQGQSTQYPIEHSASGPADLRTDPAETSRAARIWVRESNGFPDDPELNLALQVPPAPGGAPSGSKTSAATLQTPTTWLRCIKLSGSFGPNEVPISGVGSSVRSGPGGEISFEETVDGQAVTRIARAVSAAQNVSGGFEVLVRTSDRANLPRTGQTCRYFAPYLVRMQIDVLGDGLSDLRLPIPSGDPKRNAYIAIVTMDLARESNDQPPVVLSPNISPLSAPLQVVAVRPPPVGKPDPPVPFGTLDMPPVVAGYTTPPDRQGRATAHLEWSSGSLNPPSGVRYEVGRALDNGLVATDKRNWLTGRSVPGLPPLGANITAVNPSPHGEFQITLQIEPVPAPEELARLLSGLLVQGNQVFTIASAPVASSAGIGFSVRPEADGSPDNGAAQVYPLPILPGDELQGTLSATSSPASEGSATVRADFTPDGGASIPLNRLRGGRLRKPRSAATATPENQTAYYQITGAEPPAGDTITLLLYPLGAPDALASGEIVSVQSPPDYSRIGPLDSKLRQLADKTENEDAFSMATGAPISSLGSSDSHPLAFRDEVAGIGRNRFFYRVRAVDAAENRSAWSATSVPFFQVDTTPPEAPRDFTVTPDDRAALLTWAAPSDPSIVRYLVYRNESRGDADPLQTSLIEVSSDDLRTRKLTIIGGGIAFPAPVDSPIADVEVHTKPGPGPDLFIRASELTRIVASRILSLNPLVPNGTWVVVAIGDPADPSLLTHRPDDVPLSVVDGEIDLGFDADGRGPLLAIHKIDEQTPIRWPMVFAMSPDLRQSQASEIITVNRLEPDGTTTAVTVALSGLNSLLPDGTSVSVTVRFSDGSSRILDSDPAHMSWIDRGEPSGLSGGQGYTYGIAAVRRVLGAAAVPGGPPRELFIRGSIAGPVGIRGIDRSTPAPPSLASACWVGADGDPATPLSDAPGIRMSLRVEGELPGKFFVERRSTADTRWSAAPLNLGRGWTSWPSSQTAIELTDHAPDPSLSWAYRVQIMTSDGRTSPKSESQSVAALRADGG